MRSIGLLAGRSWVSAVEYYGIITRQIVARTGSRHVTKIHVQSVDFAETEQLQGAQARRDVASLLAAAAMRLELAGADAVVLCTSAMHRAASAIEAAVSVPLIHVVDPTGRALQTAGIRRAGFLGPRHMTEQAFWPYRLAARFGVDLVVGDETDRDLIHRVICDDLYHGDFVDRSRATIRDVIARMIGAGAAAVILGCPELSLLIRQSDVAVPLLDSTTLHAEAAVAFALGGFAPAARAAFPDELSLIAISRGSTRLPS